MTFHELIRKIESKEQLVIAIDGPSGSGKSTLAESLRVKYGCTIFHTDDYFLPNAMKTSERLLEVGGFLEYERMVEEIFQHLDKPKIEYRHFNCQTQELEPSTSISISSIIIIEGVYSMHPTFLPYYDYTVYLTVEESVQHQRILHRSNESMLNRYLSEWIPRENTYFDTFDIKDIADIVYSVD